MVISKSQAAGMLALPEDELMFLHQQGKLKASVDQESMQWQFDFDEVLQIKAALDKSKAAEEEEEEKE